MSLINPNQRVSRGTQEDHHGSSNNNITSTPSSHPSSPRTNPNSKKKWSNLLPLFLILVFVSEIAFLGRLDLIKKADFVNSWTESFYQFTTSPLVSSSNFLEISDEIPVVGSGGDGETCEEWLEREDHVVYSRDFQKDPILVFGGEQRPCDVGCKFLPLHKRKQAEAAIGLRHIGGTFGVLRSMESASYYPDNDVAKARRKGYDVIMTTSLSSDVPVGYFSWAEYDIMAPLRPKTEKALAAAYISNCGAINSRLQALEKLEKFNVKIDSYGACHHNRDETVDKLEALKHYKFSLAFENSIEEDYVTEKYFQSLVAGSVPVVYGAPNIQDFAPSPGSILHIKELNDVGSVAKTMKRLAENNTAYNEFLRWKHDGPSDSFKALVDMAAVHSDCRLCIFLATKIHEKEEKGLGFPKRPCKCSRGSESVHHLYVRERGRFRMESIFLRSGNLTMVAMEAAVLSKFKSVKHETVWRKERPEKIRGEKRELKVYRIYPVGMTQRQALYTFTFKGISLRSHIESNPCAKFEVIFV
ncbi:hypothetical protein L6452_28171 [Arctium lappa]|uniref:Uncharacterized protein n=1 Tax=Arctium lappa TaxID=4217 RepID=A0ACB8ZXR0_ARCLA|nr:hypothetical protein L6452_28171 [Arctium lappa]